MNYLLHLQKECVMKSGAKFQTVVYRKPADYEGVISVENEVTDDVNKASGLLDNWRTSRLCS